MDEKKILVEQIELLHEQSKNSDGESLVRLTAEIVKFLCHMQQNQFWAERVWHPNYGFVTEQDLKMIRAERAERVRRLDERLKKLGVEIIC